MVSLSLSTPSTLTTRHVTIKSLIKRAERGGIIRKKILSYQRYGFRVSDSKYSTPRESLMIDSLSTHDKGVIKCLHLEWWLLIRRLHGFHRHSIGNALEIVQKGIYLDRMKRILGIKRAHASLECSLH